MSERSIGPVLPPHFQKKEIDKEEEEEEEDDEVEATGSSAESPIELSFGPELPPHLLKIDEVSDYDCSQSVVGPILPPALRRILANRAPREYIEIHDTDSEDESYGPLPEGHSSKSKAQIALEERAIQLKLNQLEPEEEKVTREEWMLELPAAKTGNFGMGPRQFRSKPGPDMSDRSSWTDTPEEKAKRKQGKVEKTEDVRKYAEMEEMRKRDKDQERIAKKHKQNKDSLVDMHKKKMKKDKDEAGPTERKPFNRETDLQVNRFDEAQKKAVLKKAQLLDTRFSSGQSKFL